MLHDGVEASGVFPIPFIFSRVMTLPVLPSTVFLTFLLAIGLFFFIRASTKDRTEVVRLVAHQPQVDVLTELERHFLDRAYRLAAVDADTNQVRYEGRVRPSVFLAVFLSGLAMVGGLCLVLVLAIAYPESKWLSPALLLLAPLAGVFYWRTAGRTEAVVVQLESPTSETASALETESASQQITVTAHRDEIIAMRQAIKLATVD